MSAQDKEAIDALRAAYDALRKATQACAAAGYGGHVMDQLDGAISNLEWVIHEVQS